MFHDKVLAACHVINGFGKTTGLVQIDELGTLETPILFTNTLSVGTVETALVKYMLERNPDICETTGSVNPVVCECNDSGLNDIRGLHVTEAHVAAALADCKADFAEGAVGAGRGMRCHGLKGGIGSASRLVELDGKSYTIGALVLSITPPSMTSSWRAHPSTSYWKPASRPMRTRAPSSRCWQRISPERAPAAAALPPGAGGAFPHRQCLRQRFG